MMGKRGTKTEGNNMPEGDAWTQLHKMQTNVLVQYKDGGARIQTNAEGGTRFHPSIHIEQDE